MTGHDDWYEIKKRYLVKETIGSGGFGKVKRAVHIATTETVAIKVCPQPFLTTFLASFF